MVEFLFSDYTVHLAILVGIYLILAQSFNVSFGLGQLFNLAHIAAYAIGAYTTALLTVPQQLQHFLAAVLRSSGQALRDWGVTGRLAFFAPATAADLEGLIYFEWAALWPPAPLWLTLPASMLSSSLLALLLGAISLRLAQEYFAIGTLAFSAIVMAVLINWKDLTRGVLGIPGIPRPAAPAWQWPGGQPLDFYNNADFLALLVVLVLLVQFMLYLLFRSRLARSLRAQAEYEHSAWSLGKDTQRIRLLSFIVSAAGAGLAGSLFAYYLNYIDPSSFALTEMIFVLTIVVVGRPGSFGGCLAATVFLVLLPEPLRFIEMSPAFLGPLRQLLYAVILFVVVYVNRSRIFPQRREV